LTSLNLAFLREQRCYGAQTKTEMRRALGYAWLLYLLNCAVYGRTSLPVKVLTLMAGGALLILIYRRLTTRVWMDHQSAMLALLSITMPLSFRSVFGTGYAEIPLPWFYLLLLLMLFTSIERGSVQKNPLTYVLLILPLALIVPLVISKDFIAGIKEYLGYASFLMGCIVAGTLKNKLSRIDYAFILPLYVNGVVFAASGVVFQFVMLNFFEISTFYIMRLGGNRDLYLFLFYDMSGISVYLGTAIIILLFLGKRVRNYILSAFVFVAMALTSSRTGVLSLVIILIGMVLFAKRNEIAKTPLKVFLAVMGTIAVAILFASRSFFTSLIDMVLSDNGRFQLITSALVNFAEAPLFGKGLDYASQMKALGSMAPHFALVDLLVQTGILITLMFISALYYIWRISRRSAFAGFKWVYAVCIIGASFAPSFFALRFFTLICMFCIAAPSVRRESAIPGAPVPEMGG